MRGVALAALLVLAACGADSSPTSTCAGGAGSPEATPPYNDDPELADRIPDMAGGEPIEVQTYCAAYTEDGGLTTAPAFLAEIGVDLVDVSVARSRPPEIARTDHFVEVNAWSVRCATRS